MIWMLPGDTNNNVNNIYYVLVHQDDTTSTCVPRVAPDNLQYLKVVNFLYLTELMVAVLKRKEKNFNNTGFLV